MNIIERKKKNDNRPSTRKNITRITIPSLIYYKLRKNPNTVRQAVRKTYPKM